jgi:hypothetical protein
MGIDNSADPSACFMVAPASPVDSPSVVASNWWRKDDAPVFSRAPGVFGPGHASYVQDRDGTPYIVVCAPFLLAPQHTLTEYAVPRRRELGRGLGRSHDPVRLSLCLCARAGLKTQVCSTQAFHFGDDGMPVFPKPVSFDVALPMPA